MELNSVRALKQEIRQQIISPFVLDEIEQRRLGIRSMRISQAIHPRTFALGITKRLDNDYKLAVRFQNPLLQGSRYLESIRTIAKEEVEIRFIGHVHKLLIPLNQKKCMPLEIGCSTGHFRITAGTLGAFVKSRQGGQTGILSNNHVFADENRATIGDDIIQPGRFDGGHDPADRIAMLSSFIPLDFAGNKNSVDCAIGTLESSVPVNRGLHGVGMLSGLKTSVDAQELVSKIGRTTGLTHGKITCFELDDLHVGYDQGDAAFDGQIEIEGIGSGPFSQGGDSGSLIFDQNRQAVALLFACGDTGGSNGMGLTYANHLPTVLDSLSVDLIT